MDDKFKLHDLHMLFTLNVLQKQIEISKESLLDFSADLFNFEINFWDHTGWLVKPGRVFLVPWKKDLSSVHVYTVQ